MDDISNILSNVKKIAVLRANALGDFIITLPALYSLKEKFPQAEVVLLAKQWHKDFLEGRPGPVDRVIVLPKVRGVGERFDYEENNEEEINTFHERMKNENFDIAIQLHGGGKFSNPFILNFKAKLNIGLRSRDAEPLDLNIPYVFNQHEHLRFLEVTSLIGVKPVTFSPKVEITEKDRMEAGNALARIRPPFVVIHPGAMDLKRAWPTKNHAEISDSLCKMGYSVVLIGIESEKHLVDEIENFAKFPLINLCGQISLNGLVYLLSKASLLIGTDSGPMHLSNAANTPSIGLYWAFNYCNYGIPTRSLHTPLISWNMSCRECGKHLIYGDVCNHKVSMIDDISIEAVLNTVKEVLM